MVEIQILLQTVAPEIAPVAIMSDSSSLFDHGVCEMLVTITETDRGAVLNVEGVHALLPSDAAYSGYLSRLLMQRDVTRIDWV